jgi:hypothetical protein
VVKFRRPYLSSHLANRRRLGVTIVPRTLTVTAAQLAEAGHLYVVLGLTDPLATHPVTVIFETTQFTFSNCLLPGHALSRQPRGRLVQQAVGTARERD